MFCRISALELWSLATEGTQEFGREKNREFDIRTPFACYRRDARIPYRSAEFAIRLRKKREFVIPTAEKNSRSLATIQTQEFNFRIFIYEHCQL